MSNELIPLFPTPLYATEIDYDIDNDYLESLEYERYPDDTGDVSLNKNILNEEQFSDLKGYIDKHMDKFYFDYLRSSQGKPVHTGSWINVHKPNDASPKHVHCNSCFSGVFYLKVPENSGSIKFSTDRETGYHTTSTSYSLPVTHNALNCAHFLKQVSNNSLVIFPSHLVHSTEKNLSSENRYSLAFNYFVEGDLGSDTGRVNIKVINS